jgi:molecular chaperone DnaK
MTDATRTPVRLNVSGLNEFITAYMRNPALDGIYIRSDATAPIGTKIDLTIVFSPERLLKTNAVVAEHHPKWGLGLRFENLHPAYRKWIDDKVGEFTSKLPDHQPMVPNHQLRRAASGSQLQGAQEALAPETLPEDLVLGIDLGTCNSAACVVIGGNPVMIDLRDTTDTRSGVRSIPSVLGIDAEGAELLGQAALSALPVNPKGTIFGAKRFIGRVYESSEVQTMVSRFPYKIVPGANNRVAVEINGRPLALTAVSARILAYIRAHAEQQIGKPIQHAIITVPAYYNDNQRDAVVQAGKLSGLNVLRVLNEPTSAAIAYGLHRTQPRKLIVYDLGGGTFDVSVMQVDHNSLQVLATAGDTFLGGEDFDNALVKQVVDAFQAKTRKTLSQNSAAMATIKASVEQAKRRLSTHDKTMVSVRTVTLADRTQTKLEIELTRQRVEQLVEPFVTRTLKICEMVLKEARLTPKDIGDVILVGGQSRMPYVQQRVRDFFKIAPRCDINPDEAVALGAGLLGSLRNDTTVTLKDVLSMSIGVAVGGRMKPIIARNTPVPVKKSIDIVVSKEQFPRYSVDVWQGDAPELHRNEHLGQFKVDCVDPGKEDPVPLRIEFILTPDCLLRVRVTHRKTEQSEQVVFTTRDNRGNAPPPATGASAKP